MPLPAELFDNGSFSKIQPGLQVAVDSTSLGTFKECPRKYYYSIIWGYQPVHQSVHLTFGLLLHKGREIYYSARSKSASHDDALDEALEWGLKVTWNSSLKRPWISNSSEKNRHTFLRSLIWYLDKYGENDPLETVILKDGSPAVELKFEFDSGFMSQGGERVRFCGWLDRLVKVNSEIYVSDLKTSKHQLDGNFFKKFSPDNQFSMYSSAGQIVFEQPTRGLILDGLQVIVTDTRFQRGMVDRSPQYLEEWLDGQHFWLSQMESCAQQQKWPQNDKSCGNYLGCEFREVCSKSPASRQTWLNSEFKRRVWDPTAKRGDI
jgi:hypothetical protein